MRELRQSLEAAAATSNRSAYVSLSPFTFLSEYQEGCKDATVALSSGLHVAWAQPLPCCPRKEGNCTVAIPTKQMRNMPNRLKLQQDSITRDL